MFSGIIVAVGKISRVEKANGGVRLAIEAGSLVLSDVDVGDSITVNGACLTVIKRGKRSFRVDVSRETLKVTAGLDREGEVNLEKALRLSDRLDGHLVLGHVDGVGKVTKVERRGGNRLLRVRVPASLARYVASKGSIAVHGVSLTVNAIRGAEFEVNLIPHTLAVTTLKDLRVGDRVNLEVDPLARYAERLLRRK
ncbi:MAG TPA: riboflavin synthase [Burkholderiales bacterium]|nr:riboflavin synthase [Burkholderiales bacterium]